MVGQFNLPDFLGGDKQPVMMSPINAGDRLHSAVAAPTLAQSQGTTGFFSQANDFLTGGLDLWKKYEEVKRVKDSSGIGQKQHLQTVQQQAPAQAASQNVAQQMQQKLGAGLKSGVAVYGGLIALGIIGFYILTRRK